MNPTITTLLLAAAALGNFTSKVHSTDIPGKTAYLFDYKTCGDICGHNLRGAALFTYRNGESESNQYGPCVFDAYRVLINAGKF